MNIFFLHCISYWSTSLFFYTLDIYVDKISFPENIVGLCILVDIYHTLIKKGICL